MKYEPPRPSAYTPFLRRFTDERARDLEDTIALYRRVKARHNASCWSNETIIDKLSYQIVMRVADLVEIPVFEPVTRALTTCQYDIIALEETIFTMPEIDWGSAVLTLQEQVDLRRFLRAKEYFLANEENVADELATALINLFAGIINELPKGDQSEHDTEATFTVPLYSTVRDINDLVDRALGTIYKSKLAELGLFTALHDTIYRNACEASGIPLNTEPKKPFIQPADSKLPPAELVETYLKDTPLYDLLMTPVPFSLPRSARFEHTHIVAGTGHGKTQTLQHLIMHDLMQPPDQVPSLVIIDSQGDMLTKLSRLELFNPEGGALANRLIIIDPTDVEHPPALGLFDIDLPRLRGYSPRYREQIMNGVIELYDFIFGGLLGAELTQKQSVIFRYLARLMLVIPDATILTLKDVMQDATPFVPYFDRLDGMARDFFIHEFNDRQFAETKKQILRRLWGVLENPTFERLFSNPRNRIDMFDALNSGKIVLVNTAKDFLKAERSSILGRFFIALTFQAALERAAIPEQSRHPAFLYIDEAADYFDDTIDSLLSQARKFKLGVIFAHQYLDQLPRPLLASIMTNTSVKFAGGVSSSDANALARNMGTSAEAIGSTRKRARETEFAAFVRNHTERAVTVTVPFGTLERAPTMPSEAFARLIETNRCQVVVPRDQPPQAATDHDTPRSDGAKPDSTTVTEPDLPPSEPVSDDDWRS